MRAWAGVAVLAAGLSMATGAAAQLPQPGARSLRVSAGGSNSIGVWRMRSERTNLGLNLGLSAGRRAYGETGETYQGLSLEPAVKRYSSPTRSFAPFVYGSVLGSYEHRRAQNLTQHTFGVGGQGAVGMDWFPVRNVSVGGQVGVQATYSRTHADPDSGHFPGYSTLFAQSLNSGLVLHLYF